MKKGMTEKQQKKHNANLGQRLNAVLQMNNQLQQEMNAAKEVVFLLTQKLTEKEGEEIRIPATIFPVPGKVPYLNVHFDETTKERVLSSVFKDAPPSAIPPILQGKVGEEILKAMPPTADKPEIPSAE